MRAERGVPMEQSQDAESYYATRWRSETKANPWAMRRASAILGELALFEMERPRILDYGCGTGWMTEILNQFGDAQGVDLAPGPARSRYPHLRFHDIHSVPDEPFDVVVSQEVIEHIDDQASYVDDLSRVLRKGGYLILTTPNAAVSLRHRRLLVQPVENHLTHKALRRILETRFSVLQVHSFFYGFARWRPYRIQLRFGRLLNAGLHLMAVCRK